MNKPDIIARFDFQRLALYQGTIYVEAIDNLIDKEVRIPVSRFEDLKKQMINRITKILV